MLCNCKKKKKNACRQSELGRTFLFVVVVEINGCSLSTGLLLSDSTHLPVIDLETLHIIYNNIILYYIRVIYNSIFIIFIFFHLIVLIVFINLYIYWFFFQINIYPDYIYCFWCISCLTMYHKKPHSKSNWNCDSVGVSEDTSSLLWQNRENKLKSKSAFASMAMNCDANYTQYCVNIPQSNWMFLIFFNESPH